MTTGQEARAAIVAALVLGWRYRKVIVVLTLAAVAVIVVLVELLFTDRRGR